MDSSKQVGSVRIKFPEAKPKVWVVPLEITDALGKRREGAVGVEGWRVADLRLVR